MADAPGRFNVLVVDDSEDILDLVELVLAKECTVKRAQDGRSALRLAFEKPHPDLILLDVEMPGSSGYDVCKALKASPAVADVPIIFLTQRTETQDVVRGFQLGAIDYFTKPITPPVLAARMRAHIELITRRNQQETLIVERSAQLEQTRMQLIRRLGRAMEYHETSAVGNRVVRLAHYARILAQTAGAKTALCDLMMKAAPLHDIGKLGVSAQILRKTEKLSVPEREQMQRHPEIGAEIIGEHHDPLLSLARTLALTHHERWDGTGYPSKASGNDIPWPGRVMAVVDVFEGMTATQFHRDPIPADIAADEIVRASGRQFDPQIVEAFKKALPAFRDVRDTYADALGDMLNLDFASSAPAPPAPAPEAAKSAPEAVKSAPDRAPAVARAAAVPDQRAAVEARALQAVREGDAARAKALAGAQARLKVERDLASAAVKDLSTQQAARKRAEEAAAREAEALELSKRRIADEAAAAQAAQERAAAEGEAANAARRSQQAAAQLSAQAEARGKAEEALAAAAVDKRQAEEALAKTSAELAATQAQAAASAKRRADEETATRLAAEKRAQAEAEAARAAQQLDAANARALVEAQKFIEAERALALAAEQKATAEEAARRKALELTELAQRAAAQAKARLEAERQAASAAERRLEQEALATQATQERAEAETALARAAQESSAAKALAKRQLPVQAEEIQAAAPRRGVRRSLVYLAVSIVLGLAAAVVLFESQQEPPPRARPQTAASPAAVAVPVSAPIPGPVPVPEPEPILIGIGLDGAPLQLRLDTHFENLVPREDIK